MLTVPLTTIDYARMAPLRDIRSADGMLLVHEIYKSIQGESTFAGLPCIFIRLSVCNLRCLWCDTPHAFTQGQWLSQEEIVGRVAALNCPLVELTGGEPLLQAGVHTLMKTLLDQGKKVLLETAGHIDIAPVDPRVHIIMDLKCPDSGECPRNNYQNLEHLKQSDEIKFVLASRVDFDWMIDIVRRERLDQRFAVLASIVFNAMDRADVVAWLLETGLNIRFQLQMHKFIWDPKARGV